MKNIYLFSVMLFLFSIVTISCDSGDNNQNNIYKESETVKSLQSEFDKIDIRIVSPSGNSVAHPLPMVIEGVVENYTSLSASTRNETHFYVVQRSQGEVIYHIQPELNIYSDGKFRGEIWLGSESFGNKETFELNLILTTNKIPLQSGDNPISEIPLNQYLTKIVFIRNDK